MRHVIGAALVVLVAAAAARAQPASSADLDALLEASADAYQAGEVAKGVSLLETVRDRARAGGLPAQEIEALLRLALADGARGEFDLAYGALARAREIAARTSRAEDEARVILQQAIVTQSQILQSPRGREPRPAPGQSPAELARAAWDRFKAIGSRRGMAQSADALAYYLDEGPEKDAIRVEALALPPVDGHPAACRAVHQWGDQLFIRGRLAEAHTQLVGAVACFAARHEYSDEANTRVSLGRVYRAHGRLTEALAEYERAEALQARPGNRDSRGTVQSINAVAVTLQAMGRYDEARRRYEVALARARQIAPSTVPFLLANLSALNGSTGRNAEALALLDEALQNDPDTPYLGRRLQQRAHLLADLGRREEALTEATRAVERTKNLGPEESLNPRVMHAQLLAELGRFEEAEADLRGALEVIERVRANSLPSDVMRRGFSEVHQAIFAAAIDIFGRERNADAALEIAERARARAFLDLRARQTNGPIAPAPATVADARALASRLRSTIVAYWVGPTTVTIWVVRAGQPVRLVRVPVLATQLTSLIRAASGVAGSGTGVRGGLLMTDRAQRAPWRELHTYLIAPIARWLPAGPGSRLTIVPHGPLFALSFAGLRDASDRYLIERHDLHYVPAIAALAPAAARRTASTGALLVGDPGRIDGEPGTEALPALPWAHREVEAVRTTLAPPLTVLTGDEATESGVRATLAGRRVVHFATHGVISNEPNQPSYLALHPAGGDDGRLSADDIYGSSIDADLVVLSACRTALGPVEGDGVIGFTRAFLSAGARSVVATQWDVSDQVSYDVMRGFYARRARGLPTSRALRGAQLAVLRALRAGTVVAGGGALPETPRLWAAFILTGEP